MPELYALGGLAIGLVIGFLIGLGVGSRNSPPTDEDGNPKYNFGPCPKCGNQCNLEEWRCGSCNHQLHTM